jgi:ATP-dependent protease ClpP protease subunit
MRYTEVDKQTAELKFYGYIGFWWTSAKDFSDTIDEIQNRYSNLIIRLHSYGGEVMEGNTMFNCIQRSKLKTTFVIEGVSASMASIVMLSGDSIEMAENAFVMIHAPSSWEGGTADDLFRAANLLKKMQKNFATVYMRKTKKSQKEVDALFDGNDHWFSADECKAMGLIDNIISPVEGTPPVGQVTKPESNGSVEFVFGQYAAMLTPQMSTPISSLQNTNTDMNKEQKQAAIDKYGLKGVTAESSDVAVLSAMDARFAEMSGRITALEAGQGAVVEAQATAILSAKETQLGKPFNEEQKKTFMTVAKSSGLEVLKTVLSDIAPTPNVQSLIAPEAKTPGAAAGSTVPADRKDWTWATWREKDAAGLDRLSTSKNADDKAAFAALYKNEFGKEPGEE